MTSEGLGRYLAMLFDWNKGAGLTAFRDQSEALAKGVVTAEAALPLLPENGNVIDVGSGGGFPAIPIALKRPSLHFTLCEPAPLKAAFLRAVARELGLTLNVRELQVTEFLAERGAIFHAATVRGVKLRPPVLKALKCALAPGGALLVWTGSHRVAQYGAAIKRVGFKDISDAPLEDGSILLCAHVPRGTGDQAP